MGDTNRPGGGSPETDPPQWIHIFLLYLLGSGFVLILGPLMQLLIDGKLSSMGKVMLFTGIAHICYWAILVFGGRKKVEDSEVEDDNEIDPASSAG